ncbi:MAG: hypothetical protein L3J56_04320, partial [Bacteroidales bacterium]|nr:hypothetical protein [Bacteroidales bacterium]
SNRFISFKDVEQKFNVSYDEIKEITKIDYDLLTVFENEGLIKINKKEISVTYQGMFFLRNIANLFDPLRKQTEKQFSKSL